MSHKSVECDHAFGNWEPVPRQVYGRVTFAVWQRQCFLCGIVDELQKPPEGND